MFFGCICFFQRGLEIIAEYLEKKKELFCFKLCKIYYFVINIIVWRQNTKLEAANHRTKKASHVVARSVLSSPTLSICSLALLLDYSLTLTSLVPKNVYFSTSIDFYYIVNLKVQMLSFTHFLQKQCYVFLWLDSNETL